MRERRRLASVVAAGLATGLVLVGCTGDDGDGDGPGAAVIQECVDDPVNCLSGPTQDGGSITWMIPQPGSGWLLISPDGGSVYSLQMLTGVLPMTGWTGADGEYVFNMDLLAEEPQLINEEPWTYQFVLADGAVWDDGTPISGDDFLVTWYMSQSPGLGNRAEGENCASRGAEGADRIQSIEVSEDGKTVTVALNEGESDLEWFGSWGTGAVSGGLYPAHIADREGLDWQDPDDLCEYSEYLNTTRPDWSGGPYRMVSGDLETGVVLERNPNWYGEPPPLESVNIRVLVDSASWVDAYANGEIDGGSPPDVDQDVVEQLQEHDDALVHVADSPSWEHVDLNLVNPQLQDMELRRAIFTAIDRGDIADRNYGRVYPDYTLRNTFSSWLEDDPFYQDHITDTGFGTGNIEEAHGILEDAGYQGFDGEAGSLTLDGETIGPFRLRATESVPRSTSLTLIQQQLGEIGIQADIEFTDSLGETLFGGDYDIIQFGWSGSPAFFVENATQYAVSTSGSNFGKYDNPAYDEPAEAALVASTLEESAELTNQAYEIMAPEAYILPLYWTPGTFFVRDTYANVRNNGYEQTRAIYNIGEWGLAADE